MDERFCACGWYWVYDWFYDDWYREWRECDYHWYWRHG